MENYTDNTSRENKSWAGSFFTIWTGQAISLLGSQMVQFALIWWLTKITGSAIVLDNCISGGPASHGDPGAFCWRPG